MQSKTPIGVILFAENNIYSFMNPFWGSWLETNYKNSFCKENINIELCLPPKSNQPRCTWKTSVSRLFLYAWQNQNVFFVTKFCVLLSTTYLWRSGSWTIAQNQFIFYLLVTLCCVCWLWFFSYFSFHPFKSEVDEERPLFGQDSYQAQRQVNLETSALSKE